MSATRRTRLLLTTLAVAAGGFTIPASMGFAEETPGPVPNLSYDLPAPVIADDLVVAAQTQGLADDGEIAASDPAEDVLAADDAPATELANGKLDPELECMAKVVHHEAGNQTRRGQLAVAQLMVNRMESGRFANSICGVANQPGQFFPTASYHPRRDTDQWRSAVAISLEAMAGKEADVVPGAMFYHASYQAPNRWFRTRQRVATLGDHIFYR